MGRDPAPRSMWPHKDVRAVISLDAEGLSFFECLCGGRKPMTDASSYDREEPRIRVLPVLAKVPQALETGRYGRWSSRRPADLRPGGQRH